MSTNFPAFPHTTGFVGFFREPVSQAFSIRLALLSFPMLLEIVEKTHAFPISWSVPQDENLMEKITHTMRKVWVTIFQVLPHKVGLTVFSHVMGNWWENTCISHLMKCATGWESNGKNHTYYKKSMSNNFPGSPHTMGFVVFPCTMGNWWWNPCISHMMMYSIGWEPYGEKSPILWEKYEYQFPRSSSYDGFRRIFPGTNFPDFPHSMELAVFCIVMGN